MSWIPAFRVGPWNAWLFMVVYPLQWVAVLLLPRHIAERTSHAPEIVRTRRDRIMALLTQGLWIGATLYSLFVPLRTGTPWFWAGLALFLVGLALLVLASIAVAGTPADEPFTSGIYRFSRHPMYLSMILVYLGVSAAAASWVFLLITVATFFLQRYQLLKEEAYCGERFGQAYREYRAVTARWLGLPSRPAHAPCLPNPEPGDRNDLGAVEDTIYPVFARRTEKDARACKAIRQMLLSAMQQSGVKAFERHVFWWYVNRAVTRGLKQGIPLIRVEASLRKFVRKVTGTRKEQMAELSRRRAEKNFEGIRTYVVGQRVLDLGAGDGLLALEIKNRLGKDVVLVDVVDYNRTDLPMTRYDPRGVLPLPDGDADTTLLYTVLHHSRDPDHLLEEAARVTRRRLIIKEAYAEDDAVRTTNGFVDWFYNRVIGDEDIDVPLNFRTVQGWATLLQSCGFSVVETAYIGIDEPAVPENHVFIIADRSVVAVIP